MSVTENMLHISYFNDYLRDLSGFKLCALTPLNDKFNLRERGEIQNIIRFLMYLDDDGVASNGIQITPAISNRR